jgi:tRNA (cmo5U34)-methyltransferase
LKEDKYFDTKLSNIDKFQFNRDVAEVFDDMVSRSVPFYNEIHSLLLDMIDRVYQGGKIYDLGCSTGTTMGLVAEHLKKERKERGLIVGVDNSQAMIDVCQKKLNSLKIVDCELRCEGLEETKFEEAGLVIMNYTLQFIRPESRPQILKNIYQALRPGSAFILSEKINLEDKKLHQLTTELYYDFKRRRGYSELEISQKREALEEVLRPLTPTQQLAQLREAGFEHVDVLFRWYNFTCYVGIK